jgi:hypothetical protein
MNEGQIEGCKLTTKVQEGQERMKQTRRFVQKIEMSPTLKPRSHDEHPHPKCPTKRKRRTTQESCYMGVKTQY